MRKASFYYNKTFVSNESGLYTIVVANDVTRMKAVFNLTGTEVWVDANQVDSGCVVDKFKKNVYGVGYLGNQPTRDSDGKRLKEYNAWKCMFERCYGDRRLNAYEFCIVSDEFHSFEYFADWYNSQKGSEFSNWHLDKDILSDGCKIYAEDTCVLVPQIINNFFVKHNNKKTKSDLPSGVKYVPHSISKPFMAKYNGHGGEKLERYFDNEWEAFLAYKRAKEARAKELAKEYYGLIDQRVYDKLMNYRVLLTD